MPRKPGAKGEPRWVLPEAVNAIHQMLIAEHGGLSGVRDQGLLDSALARPRQQAVHGEKTTLFQLAATDDPSSHAASAASVSPPEASC